MAAFFNNPTTAGNSLDFAAGTAFPATEITVTWQLYRITDRGAQFETPWSVGPTTFDAGNDYYVPFIGDGGTSNAWASGAEGADQYANTLPQTRRWYRQAFRSVFRGSAAPQYEFYFDLDHGFTQNLTQWVFNTPSGGATPTFGATTTMTIGSNPWNRGPEAVNAFMRAVKLFTKRLDKNLMDLESRSSAVVYPGNKHALWGQWPLYNSGKDISGNGRHTTAVGTVTYFPAFDDGLMNLDRYINSGPIFKADRTLKWLWMLNTAAQGAAADHVPLLARFP